MGTRPAASLLARVALLAAALSTAAGCGGSLEGAEPGALEGRLTISGSSTVAPLMSDIARRFEQRHPGSRVDVQTGGSERGLADVRRGLADIGMVSRALGEAELDLSATTIAHDGLGLIVHAANPVERLDSEQVAAIYRGEIRDWSELGHPPAPITAVHKAEGRATLAVFLEHFGLSSREVRPTLVIGENQEGIRIVAGNPAAIGYVSIGAAEVEIARGTRIRLLAIDGVPATTASVASGRLAMTRPLLLVTQAELGELGAAILEFARSGEVADLVEEYGFVAPHAR